MLREWIAKLVYSSNVLRYAVERPRILDALQAVPRSGALLDAGAGGGEYAETIYAKRFRTVFAMEYDARNFGLLCRRAGLRAAQGGALRGTVLDLPFRDGYFDCVACTQVLEHLADDRRAAAELTRVLKPGGFLLITVPIPPAPWPERDHVRAGYRLDDLRALLAPHGVELVASDCFLTRQTQALMHRIQRFGGYAPRPWRIEELRLTRAERETACPYGLLALWRKKAEKEPTA